MSSDEIMLQKDDTQQTKEEMVKEQYKGVFENLKSEFPKKAEKCHRFYGRMGYKQRTPNKDGNGGKTNQVIQYVPCPCPKCDDFGELIGIDRANGKEVKGFPVKDTQFYQRCNYTPPKDMTQEQAQIDLIIHHERHHKWFIDYFSVTENISGEMVTRPPLHTPNPWQTKNFPPYWGQKGDEMIQGEGMDADIEREKIRRRNTPVEKSEEEVQVEEHKQITEDTVEAATRQKKGK